MPLFSIIIPVYKVENYLHKCVNSVLSQNYEDYEIILVNDGSPDNCPQICDQFAANDSRIKVIHKANGGLSDARNVGVEQANGEYILFLDSDDYWEGNYALSSLAETIVNNKKDIILYGTKDVNLVNNTTFLSRGNYQLEEIRINKVSAIKSLINTNNFPGSAWVLAIKKELLISNNIKFKTGIKAEDIDWLLNVFYNVDSIDAINTPFYMYIKNRPGSITNTSDEKSIIDILYSVSKWKNILEADNSEINKYLLSYLASQYITSYIIFSKLKNPNPELYIKIKNEASILTYALGKKAKFCKFMIDNFGIRFSGELFNTIYKLNCQYNFLRILTK
ncbi:glycosyltransferase family 2 protein [Empedobacter sp. UBA6745]|uniref:glycosyltransferase family 2 protein n=1 Tax=Empedobacter sp. UBA6745 TaxID=1946447 RepID=UPI0025C6FA4C|nr:glycosyltransferase family 2 protein [Empedobacter sp. UBA6745]